MAKKASLPTLDGLAETLAASLRQAAIQPGINAYKPQDHQIQIHSSPKRGRLMLGGNRAGKTVFGAAESVYRATGNHPYRKVHPAPTRGRIVAVDFDQGVEKIVLPEVKKWIPPSMLRNGSWEDSYSRSLRTLELINKSTIEFMSYDQEIQKFAGTSRHWSWFDEEPPEPIFNECMLRLVDVKGDWWCTMTPLIEMSWTYDRFYEPHITGKPDKNVDVFVVDSLQNKYIGEEELEMALAGLSESEREARKAGVYITHTGLVYQGSFTADNIVEDLIESDRWPGLQSKWGHFLMLDHGYTNPTAVLWGCFDTEGRIIIYDEYYETKRLVRENAEAILKRNEELKVTPQYIVGDPSIKNTDPITGTSIHLEYAEYGVHIALANNDIRAGIARVSNRFANKQLYISARCEKLLWEMNRYRWGRFASEKIAQRNNAKELPIKRDDHALDALRYGVASRPALSGEVDLPMGNVLNLPTTARDYDSRFDEAIINAHNNRNSYIMDETLGSEW